MDEIKRSILGSVQLKFKNISTQKFKLKFPNKQSIEYLSKLKLQEKPKLYEEQKKKNTFATVVSMRSCFTSCETIVLKKKKKGIMQR